MYNHQWSPVNAFFRGRISSLEKRAALTSRTAAEGRVTFLTYLSGLSLLVSVSSILVPRAPQPHRAAAAGQRLPGHGPRPGSRGGRRLHVAIGA